MRTLLVNLHLYGALVAGAFIVIFGVTGSIMAFEPEIDHLLHRKVAYVTPPSQPRALPLTALGAVVSRAFPGEPVVAFDTPTSPDLSYVVALPRREVYVNQYTGQILGMREEGQGPDFLARVHQLHLRLLIRNRSDTGKTIMSWAGVAMLFLLLSGLYLWWQTKRVTIRWNRSAIRRWFDIHNVVGLFSLVFLLALTITGILIGFERTSVPLFYKLTGSKPTPRVDFKSTPTAGLPITPDSAMAIARATLPGATPFDVNVPRRGSTDIYFIRARYPEDRTPGGRSQVVVDQYSGKVLFAEGSRSAPAGARLVIANRAIHTGDIFGVPSKVVMSLASLMAVAQVVSGAVMWWKRRGKKRPAGMEAGTPDFNDPEEANVL